MSVALLNRFDALNFEDESEVKPVAPVVKAAAPAAAPAKAAAPVKTGAAATQQKAPAPRQQQQGNNRGPAKRTAAPAAAAASADPGNIVDIQKESRNRNDDRGRRGGRVSAAMYASRGKREFDRRSGTGRRDGEKKETVGQGNWGKPVDPNDVEGASVAEAIEATDVPVAAEPSTDDATAAAVEAPKEEDKFKTLDEYKGSIQKVQVDLPPARKPEPIKDAQVLVKEEEEFFTGKKASTKPRAEKKVKEVQRLDFDPKPYQPERNNRTSQRKDERPRRSGSERGERGDRGNRRSAQPVPSLNDQNAFPSLRS